MAATPESSEHTSIKERLQTRFNLESAVELQVQQQSLQSFDLSSGLTIKPLAKFEGNVTQKHQNGILFDLEEHLKLVDYTGRLLHPNKRGAISELLPPILQRLNLSSKAWLEQATRFEACYQKQFAKPRARKKTQAT